MTRKRNPQSDLAWVGLLAVGAWLWFRKPGGSVISGSGVDVINPHPPVYYDPPQRRDAPLRYPTPTDPTPPGFYDKTGVFHPMAAPLRYPTPTDPTPPGFYDSAGQFRPTAGPGRYPTPTDPTPPGFYDKTGQFYPAASVLAGIHAMPSYRN